VVTRWISMCSIAARDWINRPINTCVAANNPSIPYAYI